jgi:hypothetical protein
LWHSRLPIFITGCCLNSIISYGAEGNGLYYAIAIWTNPAAPALPQQAWLELRRMAVSGDAPKNTASRMLGFMARDIKRRFPKVKRLVSYQDCEVHLGTIYKAAGWQATVSYRGGRPNLNNAIGKKQRWELILRP